MKHTVQELIEIARRYFPEMATYEPGYDETPPDHERMPSAVGLTIVPGVQVGGRMPGEATLFDCLFSHQW